jgi:uncharacterized LabA/DUF88 family protein
MIENCSYIRSAMFIDFDNVYSQLKETNYKLAQAFGMVPHRWLNWIEAGISTYYADPTRKTRRILARICYLNPDLYSKFRAHFIRSGFRTVDCPTLTLRGKTSADVHMVVDILELLDSNTHFDEFIILSADADFRPVLLKLRENDRRTAVLAVGPSAVAYRAASDLLIDQNTFCEKALLGFELEKGDLNES